MIQSRIARVVLAGAGAAVLLGALAFLFAKTSAIDFKTDAHALALLREVKDLDTRWDADALALANSFTTVPASTPDRARLIARNLRELEQHGGRALTDDLRAMRSSLSEKESAFTSLAAAHARSLAALARLDKSLRTLAQLSAARLAARAGRGSPAMSASVENTRGDLNRFDIETYAARRPGLERRLAVLRREAIAIDPALGSAGAELDSAGRAFLDARNAEAALWRKLSYVTLGARSDLAARARAKAIEDSLDEKDRWRVYLFFYAAALLIGIGYLAMRVTAAQRQLEAANAELESRVSERTRDLSQTLKRLKESEAQLVQSEKMSSLGQMVAGVAHEINNPLAYVKNSVAIARDHLPDIREAIALAERLLVVLRSESPDPAALQATFEALDERLNQLRQDHAVEDLESLTGDGMHGIEQIAELVANLRNFSRLDRSKVASFNLNEGVAATLLIARSSLRKIDVEKRLADLPSITCSPSQINQVLLNIVNNSVQAMDKPRGCISISSYPVDADAVAVEIEDNGKGIMPDVLPKIFDPFFTTKDTGKGTGLGLSIAYKIVQQHGGRIDVRSTPGVGTSVTVRLPVVPPPELAEQHDEEECTA